MIVQRYNELEHREAIHSLCTARGIAHQMVSDLPSIGVVVSLERTETPVAMGFLRKCEGQYAIFDGIITNSDLNSEYRHEGLDLVVSNLIQEAKTADIKVIIGWSADNSTIMRSKRHGFLPIEQQLIYLPIQGT